MKYKWMWIILILFFPAAQIMAAENISPATMSKYRQIKATLEQMSQAKAGIYAKDVLESAKRTFAKAQEGIEAKREKAVRNALEMTALQIDLAKVRIEEREAAEKTAVTRAKVDKLEQRLANILAGKGDER